MKAVTVAQIAQPVPYHFGREMHVTLHESARGVEVGDNVAEPCATSGTALLLMVAIIAAAVCARTSVPKRC